MGSTASTLNQRKASASPDLLKAFLWVFLVLSSLFLLSWIVLRLNRNHPEFAFDSSRLDSLHFPEWVPAFWKDQAKRELSQGDVYSLFSQDSLTVTQNKVARLPFVRNVERVSRQFPRAVCAKVELRRPIALLQIGQKLYAIDSDGVLLPGKPEDKAGGFPFLLPIVKLPRDRQLRPPGFGQVWKDSVVEEIRQLAQELDPILDFPSQVHISTIDLSNFEGRQNPLESEVMLSASSGTKLYWGRSSRKSPYGELSPKTKIEGLKKVLAEFPLLQGVRELDLRFDRPTVVIDKASSQ